MTAPHPAYAAHCRAHKRALDAHLTHPSNLTRCNLTRCTLTRSGLNSSGLRRTAR